MYTAYDIHLIHTDLVNDTGIIYDIFADAETKMWAIMFNIIHF